MSKPRAATSVAITTVTLPSLNFRTVDSRWLCERSPLIDSADNPLLWQYWVNFLTINFMFAKTITRFPAFFPPFLNGCISSSNFCIRCEAVTTCTLCVTLLFAVSLSPPEPTVTLTGFVRRSFAISCTSRGHVAENKHVWWARFPKHRHTIARMSASNPISSIRSASSRTNMLMSDTSQTASRPPPCVSKISLIRPGVPIINSQPFCNALTCRSLAAPP
mmetsp:Transcript_47460/g.47887  ORF Transcript_47460/g.47887 Transcript_47460/m.47887 type:complete len:219 (-) Transcript_47460:33-689(-)